MTSNPQPVLRPLVAEATDPSPSDRLAVAELDPVAALVAAALVPAPPSARGGGSAGPGSAGPGPSRRPSGPPDDRVRFSRD